MFFESEHFTARIFLVQRFSWEKSSNHVMARPFSALALRVRGEGSFCFADETRLTSRAGDVLYLPHGVGYEVDYSAGEVIVFHFWESGEAMKAQNFTPRDIADLTALFGEACRCFAQDTLRSRMEVNALFYRILSALCEEEDDADTATPFRTAVSFLVAGCLDAELSVSAVCGADSIAAGKPQITLAVSKHSLNAVLEQEHSSKAAVFKNRHTLVRTYPHSAVLINGGRKNII